MPQWRRAGWKIGVRMPDGPSHARPPRRRNCDKGGVSFFFFSTDVLLAWFLPSFFSFFTSSSPFLLYYPIWVANAFPRENYASDLLSLLLLLLFRGLLSRSPPPPTLTWSSFSFFFPHICYIVDRRRLTTNQPTTTINAGWHQQSGTPIFHNYPHPPSQTFFFLVSLFLN
jgi:hypothetical protein